MPHRRKFSPDAPALIGLIGGMSWESSAQYYRLINEGVRDRVGGVASARILMWSFDFAAIEALQRAGDWDALAGEMVVAARALQKGGADVLVLCTNTLHRCAWAIDAAVKIPLLHIADPTAAAIQAAGITKVGLLGTAFTMEQDFYRGRLEREHGLEVLVPEPDDRKAVHDIIYRELVTGQVLDASREVYRGVIQRLAARGAQGIILGCTEIMLLVGAEDSPVPVFDTTTLHAMAAVEKALGACPL
jgi:aspartate racemase